MNWETFFVAAGYFVLFLIAYVVIGVTVGIAAQTRHKHKLEVLEAQARTTVRVDE